MRIIQLSRADLERIRRAGEGAYPNECCGFLVGRAEPDGRKRVHHTVPVENAREAEARHNRFLIQPEDFMKTEKRARTDGLDVIGFYHSHPDAEARPSAFDLEHAWPWYSYVIASVLKGKAERTTSWVLENNRSRFIEEEINTAD